MRALVILLILPAALLACRDGERCGDARCPAEERCVEGACVRPEAASLVIERFTAMPSVVAAGGVATLSWTTRNAAACALEPGLGAVPRSGSVEVAPAQTTAYTLLCEGAGEARQASAEVSVQGALPAPDGGPDDGGPDDGGPDGGPVVVEGALVVIDAPASVEAAAADGPILFREREAVVLDEFVLSDTHFPGSWGAASELNDAEPRCQLLTSSVVDSWLLHVGIADESVTYEGTLTFPREIVAISWRGTTLLETDALFGAPDTTYPTVDTRGFGITGSDVFTLAEDRRSVSYTAVNAGQDELRILVRADDGAAPPVKTWTFPLGNPTSLLAGATEDERRALLVNEGVTTLAAPLAVDLTAPGRFVDETALAARTLAAGTEVRSWLVHYDPAPVDGGTPGVVASATFPTPILAVIVSAAHLDTSDAVLGLADVAYPADDLRGTELDGSDEVWWSADGRSLRVDLVVPNLGGLDQLRVLTEP